MTDVDEQPIPHGAAVDRALQELRMAASRAEGRAAGDRLHSALCWLATHAPTTTTRDRLQQLLDEGQVDGFVDSWNVSCRAAVIHAQLALGYPLALEVSPDELLWLRSVTAQRDSRVYIARVWMMVAAVGSLAFNGLWTLSMGVGRHFEWIVLPFAVGTAHALAALVVAALAGAAQSRDERRRVASRYRVLGWMWLCGPAFSAIAALSMGRFGLALGMTFGAPAMLTAWLCFFAAARVHPEKAGRIPEPDPVEGLKGRSNGEPRLGTDGGFHRQQSAQTLE